MGRYFGIYMENHGLLRSIACVITGNIAFALLFGRIGFRDPAVGQLDLEASVRIGFKDLKLRLMVKLNHQARFVLMNAKTNSRNIRDPQGRGGHNQARNWKHKGQDFH